MARFTVRDGLPTWRRVALSTWRRGDDPTIYGFTDIDAGALRDWIARARAATGTKITITHAVGKAVALALAREPECNGIVSLGRLKLRDSVDVFFQVAFEGGRNLSGAKIERADTRSVVEIARELERTAQRIRGKGDTPLQKSQGLLKHLPPLLLGPALRAGEFAMFDLGLDLSRVGIPYDPFGSVMVTNVGSFGIEQGVAPLMPISRTPILLCVGALRDRVVAVDGKPVVRPMITLGGTFDHRVIDGFHAGRLATHVKHALENPDEVLAAPPPMSGASGAGHGPPPIGGRTG